MRRVNRSNPKNKLTYGVTNPAKGYIISITVPLELSAARNTETHSYNTPSKHRVSVFTEMGSHTIYFFGIHGLRAERTFPLSCKAHFRSVLLKAC